MICPKCQKDDTQNREMCPDCGASVKPIPVPPGGKIHFAGYDWFVLDKHEDRTLIITEKVIEKRAYHNEETAITWETSDMRKYLNGEFYNSFSEIDRSQIIEVINENPDNPWYGTSGGNPTKDRIFLLSVEEVAKYFGDNKDINIREKNPGWDWLEDDYIPWFGDSKYNVNRRAVDDDGIVRFWTLRTPGANSRYVTTVMGFCNDGFDQGAIDMAGWSELIDGHLIFEISNFMEIDTTSGLIINGVRPALWLNNI